MAAADTLDDLTTKVAEKLNALYSEIGNRALIGVSSDAGNLLSSGSDQRPYFDGSNIAIGVSANAGNDLTLGTDNKPYLANDKYVPLTRQFSVGIGLNPVGDLSEDRTISLDLDYLDSRYSAGYKQRGAVRVATASNITLSGLQTIDGVAVVAGNRVLVRAQTDASENGIWVVAAGAWTRASDFDEPVLGEVEQGAAVFVEEGALLDKTGWTLKTPPPYVMGTTPLEFDQYAGASSYVEGNLITIAGNQINHDSGSWSNKSNLSGATVISNLSVDAYGHPTNWTVRNLTAGNIGAEPSFSKNTAFNKNFGTSAGTVAQGNDSRINNGQTAFGWGNHASAGYITGSYTGFDSRYFRSDVSDTKNGTANFNGDVNIRSEARFTQDGIRGVNILTNSTDGVSIGSYTSHDFEIKRGNSTKLTLTNSGVEVSGILKIPDNVWMESTGGQLVRRTSGGFVNVGGDGTINPPVITLYSDNEIRVRNFRPIIDDSGYEWMNMTSGGYLRLGYDTPGAITLGGGVNPRWSVGSNNYDLYHQGNLRSNAQNDDRYLRRDVSDIKQGNTTFSSQIIVQGKVITSQDGIRGVNILTNSTDGASIGTYTSHDFEIKRGNSTKLTLTNSGVEVSGAITGNGSALTNLNGSNISTGTVTAARVGSLPASKITSGTFANARISQASVTQHEAAINAGSVDGYHIWVGTQAAYDAISVKDNNTLYFIM